jgi:hypothetical protein
LGRACDPHAANCASLSGLSDLHSFATPHRKAETMTHDSERDRYHPTRFERVLQILDAVVVRLARVERLLLIQINQERFVMKEMDDLVTEVQDIKGVQASAVITINTIADQLAAGIAGAADLEAARAIAIDLTQQLKDSAGPLSAAIAHPGTTPPAPEVQTVVDDHPVA